MNISSILITIIGIVIIIALYVMSKMGKNQLPKPDSSHDLVDQKIIGLSLVMLLPTVIDAKDALKLFVQKAEAIAIQSNGVLKNQQQQTLTDEDKQEILAM